MNKVNVLVMMGGRSPEHDVSISSGHEVVNNLNRKKYNILPTVISRDGKKWFTTSINILNTLGTTLKSRPQDKDLMGLSKSKRVSIDKLIERRKVDVVFIAMHGIYGEDGTVQGMLDLAGLKYTGSKVLTSAIGMDKIVFRKLMKSENIKIPKYFVIEDGENLNIIHKKIKKYPVFIKPFNQGSSVGANIVKNNKGLIKALKLAFQYSEKVLVDEYIKGIEVTVPIIGNSDPLSLPVAEIVPKKAEFFDYASKYSDSGSEEIVPARISSTLTNKLQKIAINVFKAIGCKGFARVDFILKGGKEPVVLEINTIPGLTSVSLFPKSAKAAGISYPKLLDKIINYALE